MVESSIIRGKYWRQLANEGSCDHGYSDRTVSLCGAASEAWDSNPIVHCFSLSHQLIILNLFWEKVARFHIVFRKPAVSPHLYKNLFHSYLQWNGVKESMVFSSTIYHPKTLIETCTCRSYIHLNSPFMCSTHASAICKLLKTAIIFYLYHPLPHEKSWFLEDETFLSLADKMQCLTII